MHSYAIYSVTEFNAFNKYPAISSIKYKPPVKHLPWSPWCKPEMIPRTPSQ